MQLILLIGLVFQLKRQTSLGKIWGLQHPNIQDLHTKAFSTISTSKTVKFYISGLSWLDFIYKHLI